MLTDAPFALARRLAAGETVYTGWATLGEPRAAAMLASGGFPAVTLDQQHGLYDFQRCADALSTIAVAGGTTVVRVPVAGFAEVSRALDAGAAGIIAPMINSVADARTLAAYAKYPPLGERSWGPHVAVRLAGSDLLSYLARANAETVLFAMIETPAALAIVDDILAVPGIDGVFVGPSDLSITISNGTLDQLSPDVDAAMTRVAEAAKTAGKVAGAYCATPERAGELARRGFRFLAIASDGAMLMAAAQDALKKARATEGA